MMDATWTISLSIVDCIVLAAYVPVLLVFGWGMSTAWTCYQRSKELAKEHARLLEQFDFEIMKALGKR